MIRRLLLSLVCLGVVACGRKAVPIAPELVHPRPPADVIASATHDGVLLRWARPSQYTSGKRMRDLAGFVVERAQDTGGTLAFAEVVRLQLEDRYRFQQQKRVEWIDADVHDGGRYFYRVLATTLDGYRSEPAGPVSIDFTRPTAPPPPPPSKTKKQNAGPQAPTSAPVTEIKP